MLMPASMPAIDELEPEPASPDPSRDTGSRFMPIRNLALCRLEGRMPTPAMLAAAGTLPCEWISAMSPAMLKSVLLADDRKLHLHMRGIETIKGLLRYEEKVIDDYRMAILRQKAAEAAAKRRLHALPADSWIGRIAGGRDRSRPLSSMELFAIGEPAGEELRTEPFMRGPLLHPRARDSLLVTAFLQRGAMTSSNRRHH